MRTIAIQHGGLFNTAKYDYNPTIDEVTSDKYIRMGEICGSNNVRGIQIIPRWVRRMNIDETVFVQTGLPIDVYERDESVEYKKILSIQEEIVKKLMSNRCTDLRYREYVIDDIYEDPKLYEPLFKRLKIKKDSKNRLLLKGNHSLIIHTHNCTGFLETMASNIPTLLIADELKKSVREESWKVYKRLLECGIVIRGAIDIDVELFKNKKYRMRWWNSEKVRKAKDMFCRLYAKPTYLRRTPNSIIRTLDL